MWSTGGNCNAQRQCPLEPEHHAGCGVESTVLLVTESPEEAHLQADIALVNETARFCHEMKIDLWNAIDLAATKPFGFQAFYPGPGVGGHCIPIDPNYLSHQVRSELGQAFRFVELAQEINAGMPAYVLRRAQDLLNSVGHAVNGSAIRLLGVTYKADIGDLRESPAEAVARGLLALGADVSYWDPYVEAWSVDGQPIPRSQDIGWDDPSLQLIVLLQAHRETTVDLPSSWRVPVLDTRGTLPGEVTRL